MDKKNQKKILLDLIDSFIAENSLICAHLLPTNSAVIKPTNWTVLIVISGNLSLNYELLGKEYNLTLSAGDVLISCRELTINSQHDNTQYIKFTLSVTVLIVSHYINNDPVYDHYSEIPPALNLDLKPLLDSFCRTLPFEPQRYRKAQLVQLLLLFKHLLEQDVDSTKYSSSHRIIIAVYQYIKDNLNLPITRVSVAERFNLNSHTMNRLLKKYYNRSFKSTLLDLRLSRAMHLLKQTALKVSEIALKCGFNNPDHFIYQFRLRHGLTPLKFRKMVNSDISSLLSLKIVNDLKPATPFSPNELDRLMKRKSYPVHKLSALTVVNISNKPINFYWINENRETVHYSTILPGSWNEFISYAGQLWLLCDSNLKEHSLYRCEATPRLVVYSE